MARDAVKISKNLDDNSITNRLDVNVSDGVESLLINGDGSINAVVSATDLDIRNLSETQDHVLVFANTAADGTGTDLVPLVDAQGHLQVDILSGASGGTEYNEDDATPATIVGQATVIERDDVLATVTPVEGDWIGLRGNARGALWVVIDDTDSVSIDDGGNSITVDGTVAATQSGTWTIDSITNPVTIQDGGGSITVDGTVTVTATDLDIRDLNATQDEVGIGDGTNSLVINGDGSINVVTQPSAGSPINNANQAAGLASAASSNHDYTATGGTFEVTRVSVSGESLGTFEILLNGTTVGYLRTSVEHPNDHMDFPDGTQVADTQVVRVIRTNDSNKAHNYESTIHGYQN